MNNFNSVVVYPNGDDIVNQEYNLSEFESEANFTFDLDMFQKIACDAINKGHNVIVCAPTASGKTAVAEHAIARTIITNPDDRVVYTTPIKVLSNQNYAAHKKIFNPMDISVGISTGDIKIDEDSQCVIATAEILRNSMYKLNNTTDNSRKKMDKTFVDSVKCVVIDEAHYMNDLDRGSVWEELIVLSKSDITLVILSATISKPEKFAKWVAKCHNKPVTLVTVDKRKVPLRHYVLINTTHLDSADSNKKLYQILSEDNVYDQSLYMDAKDGHNRWITEQKKKKKPFDKPNGIPETVKWLRDNDMLQAIFFVFAIANCEIYARSIQFDLINHEERHKIEQIFDSHMRDYKKTYENVNQVVEIKNLMMKGIAYHHSGMMPILKEIVEIIFKEGLVKVLFCTETFAVGVNCPCRTVVFTSISKYTKYGRRLISPAEYKQMAGRAGRRGLDTNGTVIILFGSQFLSESDAKEIMLGKVPEIKSRFEWNYQFYLKIIQSGASDVETFFNKSLINQENHEIMNGLIMEQTKLQNQIEESHTAQNQYTKDVTKLIEYENKISTQTMNIGFAVKLPKKQQQEFGKLTEKLKNADFKVAYDEAKYGLMLPNDLAKINNQIQYYDQYVNGYCQKMERLLTKWNYIARTDQNELKVNTKGVVAANINECNSIVLTEMIEQNIFDGCTLSEILSIASIFTEFMKSNKDRTSTYYKNVSNIVPDLVLQKIEQVKLIIEQKRTDEETEFAVGTNMAKWEISTDYLDITYRWGNGENVSDILQTLQDLEEREGSFVKNMHKTCNIVNDIACICKMIEKIELLPILENVDNVIYRDIVTITSLYL